MLYSANISIKIIKSKRGSIIPVEMDRFSRYLQPFKVIRSNSNYLGRLLFKTENNYNNFPMNITPYDEIYVSVDVETAGPSPSRYSLLSIGACLISQPDKSFYIELQPVTEEMLPETFAIHGLSMEALKTNGVPPAEAMASFDSWLKEVVPNDQVPIFVAFNAAFDWMFVSDYFHRYLGHNPFGHAAIDIKAYYMGFKGSTWKETSLQKVSRDYLFGRKISHNAEEDALDQAEIFSRLYKEARNLKT